MKSVTMAGWEIRATREGRKTEFRRVVEPDVAYWSPGENYYVKETFARGLKSELYYRCDEQRGRLVHGGWLGPNHMHYHESRLTIQVIGVRQERLQEAPADFAATEGVDPHVFLRRGQSTRDWWMDEWDKHHSKGERWEDNPQVWVVTYKSL
jgi:hypothetical protein